MKIYRLKESKTTQLKKLLKNGNITEEQFKKIANGIVVTQDGFKATLNGKTWDETQKFFLDNPKGVIYRNPDEFGYNFYTNQGNDIPHEYNMYTTDLVDIFLIGRGLSKIIGSCISYAGKKSLSKGLQHHILSRHSKLRYLVNTKFLQV